MKGDPKVFEHLQTAFTMELTAVHQYLPHMRVFADWAWRLGKRSHLLV